MTGESWLQTALSGRRVFLTGHTGFKGGWLTAWLHRYGCQVTGYALPPESVPSLFTLAGLADGLAGHYLGDIRQGEELAQRMRQSQPELVIHLAAQALVRRSYREPVETWATNVLGTVNVLEAVRTCPAVKAVVVVTTDKCYDNREWAWGYREIDPLGGYDPYSASKAGAELVVQSYRKSFFAQRGPLVASARAGNVIGGGDWSEDRLIPDAARAVAAGQTLMIRNPDATRPWQHVLDCLQGYLLLGAHLLAGHTAQATAFNFGPAASDNLPVGEMLSRLQAHWPELAWQIDRPAAAKASHEANYLYLDSSLARQQLHWVPRWNLEIALAKTASWYRTVLAEPVQASSMIQQQLDEYLNA